MSCSRCENGIILALHKYNTGGEYAFKCGCIKDLREQGLPQWDNDKRKKFIPYRENSTDASIEREFRDIPNNPSLEFCLPIFTEGDFNSHKFTALKRKWGEEKVRELYKGWKLGSETRGAEVNQSSTEGS